MGLFGHCAVGLAAKPVAQKVPLVVLLLATEILDILATAFVYAGVEGGVTQENAWSHGLFMSVVWSLVAALLVSRMYLSYRAGLVVGLLVFSHWVLDFISHPIPFPSFSWRTWQWSYGHPLPSDLPLLFGGSPKVGLGLYNSISAAEATALELGMFLVGTAMYVTYSVKEKKNKTPDNVKMLQSEAEILLQVSFPCPCPSSVIPRPRGSSSRSPNTLSGNDQPTGSGRGF